MSQRKYGRPRCEGCGLHHELCVCESLPRIDVPTRVIVVQQVRERHKPTNTGKLVPAVLHNAALVHYGFRDRPFDTAELEDPDTDYWILFPSEDARPLADIPAPLPTRRQAFVILDGTWHQCSRMRRRVPRVQELQAVTLPDGPPTIWPARTQHDPNNISTFEAVTRLLTHLHGPETTAPMDAAFQKIVSRLAYMRDNSKPYQ